MYLYSEDEIRTVPSYICLGATRAAEQVSEDNGEQCSGDTQNGKIPGVTTIGALIVYAYSRDNKCARAEVKVLEENIWLLFD